MSVFNLIHEDGLLSKISLKISREKCNFQFCTSVIIFSNTVDILIMFILFYSLIIWVSISVLLFEMPLGMCEGIKDMHAHF